MSVNEPVTGEPPADVAMIDVVQVPSPVYAAVILFPVQEKLALSIVFPAMDTHEISQARWSPARRKSAAPTDATVGRTPREKKSARNI